MLGSNCIILDNHRLWGVLAACHFLPHHFMHPWMLTAPSEEGANIPIYRQGNRGTGNLGEYPKSPGRQRWVQDSNPAWLSPDLMLFISTFYCLPEASIHMHSHWAISHYRRDTKI